MQRPPDDRSNASQDTNTLYLATFLATLGASEKHGFDMNSVCVPRKVSRLRRAALADGAPHPNGSNRARLACRAAWALSDLLGLG